MKKYQPILITGIERSGNSIVARIIESAGAGSGKMTPMMENLGIKMLMNGVCRSIGSDTEGQFPLISTRTGSPDWGAQVEKHVTVDTPWFYKSSRVCQHWRLWHTAYSEAKWVIVRRKPSDIVNSCLKTGYMRAFNSPEILARIGANTPEEGWKWWIRWHEQQFLDMVAAGIDYMEVWPERMVDGDYSQISSMIDWLGLRWHEGIIPMVEPLLWKGKQLKIKMNENNSE